MLVIDPFFPKKNSLNWKKQLSLSNRLAASRLGLSTLPTTWFQQNKIAWSLSKSYQKHIFFVLSSCFILVQKGLIWNSLKMEDDHAVTHVLNNHESCHALVGTHHGFQWWIIHLYSNQLWFLNGGIKSVVVVGEPPYPLLFWVEKGEVTDWQKASRASKSKPRPPPPPPNPL